MRTLFRLLILVVGIGIAWLPLLSHSATAQGNLVLRVDEVKSDAFPQVQVTVAVVDAFGIPIPDLDLSNFQVVEGNQQVPLTNVAPIRNPDQPISMLLAIDISGSMAGEPLEQAKQSAIQFLEGLGPNDWAAVVAFGNAVDLTVLDPAKEMDFTTDKEALKTLIGGLTTQAGQVTTPLYDALFKAVRLAAARPVGNRVVVIFTDGREGDASGRQVSVLSREAPIAEATRNKVAVFTVGLGRNADVGYMQEVALRTGGEFLLAPSADQLQAIYQSIADRLRLQYQLTFQSNVKTDGQFHALTVKAVTPQGEVSNQTQFQATCPPGKPGLRLYYLKPSEVAGGAPVPEPLSDGLEVSDVLTIAPEIISCNRIASVEYLVNDQVWFTTQVPPYHFAWDYRADRIDQPTNYVIKVRVTDENGNTGEKQVTVTAIPVATRAQEPSPASPPPAPELQWWIVMLGLILLLLLIGLIYALIRRRKLEEMHEQAVGAGMSPTVADVPVFMPPPAGGEAGPTVPEMPSLTAQPVAEEVETGVWGPTKPEMPLKPGAVSTSFGPSAPSPSKTVVLDLKSPALAWLVVEKGDRPGHLYKLSDGDTTIGRLGTCDIVLDDAAVSRQHAKVRKEGEDFVIYDLAATNPVLVNQQPITRHVLKEGDRVELGNTVLVFKKIAS